MNPKRYRLPPEKTSTLLRSQHGVVPGGLDIWIPLLFISLGVRVNVGVYVQDRDVQLPRCPLPHKLISAVENHHPVSSERHSGTQARSYKRATYGQVRLIQPSTQMLVINPLSYTEQVFSYFLSQTTYLLSSQTTKIQHPLSRL